MPLETLEGFFPLMPLKILQTFSIFAMAEFRDPNEHKTSTFNHQLNSTSRKDLGLQCSKPQITRATAQSMLSLPTSNPTRITQKTPKNERNTITIKTHKNFQSIIEKARFQQPLSRDER
jgi:hypothetical protein